MRCARSSPVRALLLLPVVLLTLLATGCQASLAIDITVDRDGAGQLSVALGADRILLDEAAAAGVDPLGDLAAVGATLRGEGWRTTDEVDADGGRLVTLAAPFDSPAAFDALAAELGGALAAPELTPFSDLRLLVTDDEVRFEGLAGLEPTAEVTALGVQPEQAIAILTETQALDYAITVALPGALLASTAPDAGEAGPVTWRIAPGQRVELLAVSDRPRGSWLVLGVAGALGGLLTLVLLGVARSRVSGGARPRPGRGSAGSGGAAAGAGRDGEASSR